MKPTQGRQRAHEREKEASSCPRVRRSGGPTDGETPPNPTDPLQPGWKPPKLTIGHVIKAHRKAGGILTARNIEQIVELHKVQARRKR